MEEPPNQNHVEWCPHCSKYFDRRVPHECSLRIIRENQVELEHWLGRYKKKK